MSRSSSVPMPSRPSRRRSLQGSAVRAGATCATLIAGLGLAATPALAATRARAASPDHSGIQVVHHPSSARPLASGTPQSPYLGGFVVAPSEGITTVSSTFKLPKATCPVPDTEDLFLGEDLTTPTGGLYQGGSDDAYAQVDIICGDGTPYDFTQVAVGSNVVDYVALNPGDTVQTRIVETPGGNTIATLNDLTSGVQQSAEQSTVVADSHVILGAESAYGQDGTNTIAKFSKVTFTNAQVGGLDWNQTSPEPSPYALNQDGTSKSTQLVPSAIPAKPSTTFSLTEKSDQ
jgi:Peptidase A4 family